MCSQHNRPTSLVCNSKDVRDAVDSSECLASQSNGEVYAQDAWGHQEGQRGGHRGRTCEWMACLKEPGLMVLPA